MKAEQNDFFNIMHSLRKLNISSMLPNISHGDFGILKMIDCCNHCVDTQGGTQVSGIAKKMRLSPPAISRALKALEEKGLVTRTIDKKDRRNTYVEVTLKGERLIEEVDAIMSEFAEAVFGQLGEETMEKFNYYLRKFVETSQEEIAKRKYKGNEKRDIEMELKGGSCNEEHI